MTQVPHLYSEAIHFTDLLQINTEDEMNWYVYPLHRTWNPGGIQ